MKIGNIEESTAGIIFLHLGLLERFTAASPDLLRLATRTSVRGWGENEDKGTIFATTLECSVITFLGVPHPSGAVLGVRQLNFPEKTRDRRGFPRLLELDKVAVRDRTWTTCVICPEMCRVSSTASCFGPCSYHGCQKVGT